jgi:hypothetical protein
MRVLLLLAAIVLILWIFRTYLQSIDGRVQVEAFDGRVYRVRDNSHKQETANALANLNSRFMKVMDAALQGANTEKLRAASRRLKERYHPERLAESLDEPTLTSYTVGKGEEVALCLRSRDALQQLYDDNLMMTVMCHEGAHIMSVSIDHTPEFIDNFGYLLSTARKLGMYSPSSVPVDYCGLHLPKH